MFSSTYVIVIENKNVIRDNNQLATKPATHFCFGPVGVIPDVFIPCCPSLSEFQIVTSYLGSFLLHKNKNKWGYEWYI